MTPVVSSMYLSAIGAPNCPANETRLPAVPCPGLFHLESARRCPPASLNSGDERIAQPQNLNTARAHSASRICPRDCSHCEMGGQPGRRLAPLSARSPGETPLSIADRQEGAVVDADLGASEIVHDLVEREQGLIDGVDAPS